MESLCFVVYAMIIGLISNKQSKYIKVCYQKSVISTKLLLRFSKFLL